MTQRVELAPGPNVVSLYVLPDDPDMTAVVGDLGDNLRSVKDPGGSQSASVYMPARGINDLATWDWRTAYVIDVEQAATLEVAGARIDPASAVPLTAGWNYLPYLHDRPMTSDSALASVAEGVDWNGVSGTVFAPGKGYRVYAHRPDTLTFLRPAPRPLEPTDYTVATLGEALALTGLEPGQTVRVEGYYAPGDGGGGVLDVTESARTPDGGTVFVPLEHQSGEVTDTVPYNNVSVIPSVPEGEDVVFGSLSVLVEARSGNWEMEIPGHLLHGHRYANRWRLRPGLDYDGGVFRDNGVGSVIDRRGQLTFQYRHTTSPLRLERRGVGATLNAHWFGARPAASGPMWTGSTDVQPILAHMVNVAAAMNETAPGSVTDILLPALDVYDYFGSIELAEGLTLRGAAGTWVVQVTNDLDHTYRPVRVRPEHTRLRVMDGEAVLHILMERDPGSAGYSPPDAKHILNSRITSISPADGVMRAGIADIVLDGNWEGNFSPWADEWATHDELEDNFRNSPAWSAFVGTNHGGKSIPQGQHLTVNNVAIFGYASNGVLGNANNTWTVNNLLAGDALWNHVLYNANGTYTNLTFTGFSWGHAAWGYGTISNLVFEDGAPNPVRPGKEVVGIRGGDAYDPSELAGVDGYFTREDGTVPADIGTEITGFYFDMRGSGLLAPLNGLGPNVVIRGLSQTNPGRVVSDPQTGANALYHENGNGYQRALYPNNRVEHVVLYDLHTEDPHRQSVIGVFNTTDSVVRDIRVERPGTRANRTLTLAARRRNHEAWDLPQVVLYERIKDGPAQFIARVDAADEDAAGMDVFVRDSQFDNRTSTLYSGRSGTGELSRFNGDPSKLRVYMEDVTFNLFGRHLQNTELFFAVTRFRDCIDANSGRTSESTVALQATDFDDREALVPLGLFWIPLDRDFVEFSGAGAAVVDSWELVGSDGTPLGENKRDPYLKVRLSEPLGGRALVVNAAVRPWEGGVQAPEL